MTFDEFMFKIGLMKKVKLSYPISTATTGQVMKVERFYYNWKWKE